MNWLFKEEPSSYSFRQFTKDGSTSWAGVRNPLAQKHLRSVKKGDRVFFYHTGNEKAVVGIARATSDAYPDPDDKTGKLVVVDIAPVQALKRPVTLAEIKAVEGIYRVPAYPAAATVGHAGERRGMERNRAHGADVDPGSENVHNVDVSSGISSGSSTPVAGGPATAGADDRAPDSALTG